METQLNLNLSLFGGRKPMSPCGICLIDGSGNFVGRLFYQLDKDIAIPLVFDGTMPPLYGDWCNPKLPLDLKVKVYKCADDNKLPLTPCDMVDCLCNGATVKKIPYSWVIERGSLPSRNKHWLDDLEAYKENEPFAERRLPIRHFPIDNMTDHGSEWKTTFLNDNLSLWKLRNISQSDGYREQQIEKHHSGKQFRWDGLPLEVYEEIVKYLDGKTLINLCNTTPSIWPRAMEPFSIMAVQKRESMFYKMSTQEELDRKTMYKIWASFNTTSKWHNRESQAEGSQNSDGQDDIWYMIFNSYLAYWNVLLHADIETERLKKYEDKLRCEMLTMRDQRESHIRITRSGGGNTILNVIFPWSNTLAGRNMTVVDDFENGNCTHLGIVCCHSTIPSTYAVKIVHFPLLWKNSDGDGDDDSKKVLPEVNLMDPIVVSVCSHCVCTSPLHGGATRRIDLPVTEEIERASNTVAPIFETYENIIALWLHPGYFVFFLLVPAPNVRGYDLCQLYRLRFLKMKEIWWRYDQYRSYYLPVIREYKGKTPMLSERASRILLGDSGYLLHPKEPVYYGLALISPIYGVESFKPSERILGETVVESLEPNYYPRNGRMFLPHMLEPTCSGKGHGVFVFCNDLILAVSWDCITWIFGKLELPETLLKEGKKQKVIKVDVVYDNGLILQVNDDIHLVDVALNVKPPKWVDKVNVSEPELELKCLRIFQLGLAPLLMKITQFELNFDNGRPFFLFIAERKPAVARTERIPGIALYRDTFRFVIHRINFT